MSRLDDCYGMVTREDVSPFVVVKKGYKLIHGIWVALIEVGVPPLFSNLFLFAFEYSNFPSKTETRLTFVFVSILISLERNYVFDILKYSIPIEFNLYMDKRFEGITDKRIEIRRKF